MSTFDDLAGRHLNGGTWSANTNFSSGGSMGLSQAAGSNTTLAVINQFKLEAARSIRTSTIVLAVFNTIAAFATAMGILYDCYSKAKRNRERPSDKVNIFTVVRGTETYPFILSLGITIQGIIFAVSQSKGMDALFAKGCSLISQFMWPAIFIVPFLQVVFALEVTFRGVRSKPFPSRGKWTVAICLATFVIMLLATGLVAFFNAAANICYASLFWFVAKWAQGGFILFTLISAVLAASTLTVFIQLTRHATIETTERVLASRMVYYLGVGMISNILMIPFFLCLTVSTPSSGDSDMTLTLSMISTVVSNISGLVTGGLHLFLRSNTISTIGPRDKQAEYERQKLKHKIRGPSPSDNYFSSQIEKPVGEPRTLKQAESQENLVPAGRDVEKGAIESQPADYFNFSQPNPLRSHAVYTPTPNEPRAPEPAQLPATQEAGGHGHKRSTSYSLFPNKNPNNNNPDTTSVALLPTTTYTPEINVHRATPDENPEDLYEDIYETLKPPPKMGFSRHRRESSLISTATVQIGLRFSNVNDMPPMANNGPTEAERERVHNLEYPHPAVKSSPLSKPPARSEEPPRPNVSNDDPFVDSARFQTPEPPKEEEPTLGGFTLSPTVYSPNSPTKSKTPSPRGVGFNVPIKRSNTSPMHNDPPSSPPPQPRNRGNSDAAAETKDARSDWI
ncbi:hypothetical protein PG993_010366 [Apiospora rasikravindrae]|uniref:Uncharacterized protein n=1 Tax=Apiospora rasikravindrae TaxID=990691 RepID=A0ABR1SM10_9PEZI